jgi:hypothetical protein
VTDDSDRPETNFDRLARAIARTQRFNAPGASKAARVGIETAAAFEDALRRQGMNDEEIASALVRLTTPSMATLRLLERSQQQADDAAEQQARMAKVASRLAQEQLEAGERDDRTEVDRLDREQRSVEVAELTLGAAEAIREAVVEAVVAAATRDEAASERQERMERITWGLLFFAALTLLASIAAAVAAIVTAANTP